MTDASEDAATRLYDPLLLRARGRIGSTLRGKWRLDSLLGVGGMAAVYAGTHRNGSRAAVKVLHAELTINAEVRSRFLREGYVANSIAHEGAVKVLDDDVAEDGSLFLVTELLDGETLEDRRVRLGGRLVEDDVLSVTEQLLDVLAVAHERGVVHRDLKPENLFLTRSGQLKVLDFGIAALRSLSTASTATKEGTSMGTAAFMSPEQARGLWAEVDAQSDLWACGATMFCLLSGSLVHEGRTTNEVLLKAMTTPALAIASIVPQTSPAVGLLIDRALAFEKDKRWRDARRMQDAVRRAYHDRTGAPITTAPKMIVPESVPNRTLAGADDGDSTTRLPTTGRPVANSAPPPSGGRNRMILGAAAIAASIPIAWMAGSAVRTLLTRRPTEDAPRTVASNVAPLATTFVASAIATGPVTKDVPAPPPIPELSVTDLPAASARVVAAPPPPKPAVIASPSPSATATPRRECEPPYVVDAKTGHMRWKVECLEK